MTKPMIRLAALLLIMTASWSEASAEETVPWNTGVAVTYDGSGNIKQVGTDLYRYDVAGRLLRSDANGARWNYTYDAYGNRQTCTVVSSSSDCQGVSVNSADNRLSSPAVYDNRGNVTGLNGRTYSYDALNMQTRDAGTGVTVEYVYTADDERIAVYTTTTGAWRWTLRGASAKVLRELTSADVAGGTVGAGSWQWIKDYVWRDDLLLATRQREQAGQTPTTYHYHLDHLGTPRRVTNNNDIIVGVHDYHAFGTELSTGTNEPSHTPVQFTGHERDGTLDYMHARFYQASVGRFLSVDPTSASANPSRPQSWNRYVYGNNNPLAFMDKNGMWPTPTHENMIDQAFPGLRPDFRGTLYNASAHADGILSGGQALSRSYEHGMRAPNQTVAEAQALAAKYYREKISAAKQYAEAGAPYDALWELGHAIHLVTDLTSPMHKGWQVWDFIPGHVRSHRHGEERPPTKEEMAAAIAMMHSAYAEVFGAAAADSAAKAPPKGMIIQNGRMMFDAVFAYGDNLYCVNGACN